MVVDNRSVVDYGHPEKWHSLARKAIRVNSDQEVAANVIRLANGDPKGTIDGWEQMDFVWGRLKDIQKERFWESDKENESGVTAPQDKKPNKEKLMHAITETVARIKQIHDECPPCTAFIVYSGNADPRDFRRLMDLQKQYKEEYKVKKWDELSVKWTDVEEQQMIQACRKARNGLGFMVVR